jgi:hypothetical protein
MKTLRMLVFIFFFLPIISQAGEIYGTIKAEDGRPLANKEVQIFQKEKLIVSGTTDTNGYFSVAIKEVGNYKLVIVGFNDASFNVFSSTKSTRYNLSLKKLGEKWVLKSL